MMKHMMEYIRVNVSLSALLVAILTVACTAGDLTYTAADSDVVAFAPRFNGGVTRSTLDNVWPDETAIKVRRLKTEATGDADVTHDYLTSATSSAEAGSTAVTLSPATDADKFYWPISDPGWKFDAWPTAFHNATTDGPVTAMSVAADQSVYAADNTTGITDAVYFGYDLLYCLPDATTYRRTVPLAFQHLMARVVVIVNSSNTDAKEQVSNIAFGGGHVGLAGSVDITKNPVTWTLTSGQAGTVSKMRNTTSDAEKSANIYTYECLLPPQSYASSSDIIVITTSGDGTTPRTYKYSNTISLQPGNQYTYSLSISESGKVVLATVQVVPWETVSVPNTAAYDANNYPSVIVTE